MSSGWTPRGAKPWRGALVGKEKSEGCDQFNRRNGGTLECQTVRPDDCREDLREFNQP